MRLITGGHADHRFADRGGRERRLGEGKFDTTMSSHGLELVEELRRQVTTTLGVRGG